MKNFLRLHGTTLKSYSRSESEDLEKKGQGDQWNEYGSTSNPRTRLVTVYYGTSVDPIGSTATKEVGSICKEQ
eukprot:573675-Prorocentrum_lima.AAC.1